jgi:hypothetical protein
MRFLTEFVKSSLMNITFRRPAPTPQEHCESFLWGQSLPLVSVWPYSCEQLIAVRSAQPCSVLPHLRPASNVGIYVGD